MPPVQLGRRRLPTMNEPLFELKGPQFQPVRKWLIGFAILIFCAGVLALGFFTRNPFWQEIALVFNFIWLLGASFYLLLARTRKYHRLPIGTIGLSVRNW